MHNASPTPACARVKAALLCRRGEVWGHPQEEIRLGRATPTPPTEGPCWGAKATGDTANVWVARGPSRQTVFCGPRRPTSVAESRPPKGPARFHWGKTLPATPTCNRPPADYGAQNLTLKCLTPGPNAQAPRGHTRPSTEGGERTKPRQCLTFLGSGGYYLRVRQPVGDQRRNCCM